MFTAPPAGLVPPSEHMLILKRGHDRLFVVESARHPGYYFVAAWWDTGPSRERGARRDERTSMAEGMPRPVRADAVASLVEWLRWPVSADWTVLPTAPWPEDSNPFLPPGE